MKRNLKIPRFYNLFLVFKIPRFYNQFLVFKIPCFYNQFLVIPRFNNQFYKKEFKKFRVLFALSKNKDIKACLKVLADQKVPLYPVESDNGYCFSSEKICLLLEQLNVAPEQLIRYSSIKETLVQATLDLQEEQELLVICGTFYIMDEIKKALQSIVK